MSPRRNKTRISNKVFCTIRLDDQSHNSLDYEYYSTALKLTNCDSGYISTDSPDNQLISRLITEFNLEVLHLSPPEKINFAKNFDNVVLSHGSFSFWCGFLSQGKNVYFPTIKTPWHGDMLCIPNWIEVNY